MKTVGIIGCGNISKKHLGAIKKILSVKLVAVVDIDDSKTLNVAKEMECKAYKDYKEMIEKEKPQIVHICVPHYLHAEICEYALKKNINVILEKPGALEKNEFERLIEIQKSAKCISTVVFQNRLNNSVKKAKKFIDSKQYGEIVGCTAKILWKRDKEYYSASEWHGSQRKSGGGVLLTQGIHTLDLMRYLLGEIATVDCVAGNLLYNEIEVEDTATALFKFEKGYSGFLIATVANCCNVPAELTIYLEKVSLDICGEQLIIRDREQGKILYYTTPRQETDTCYGSGHDFFIKQFYNDVDKAETQLPSLEEAKLTFEILERLYSTMRYVSIKG